MSLHQSVFEYCVVGGGPAGICAVAKILEKGVEPSQIMWIDPRFAVGAFGQEWANVPGNTAVESYLRVNKEIYRILGKIDGEGSVPAFDIDFMPVKSTCSLDVAAQPMQEITNRMLKLVQSSRSMVEKISRTNLGWALLIKPTSTSSNLETSTIFTKRVVLSVGVKSKLIDLPKKESAHIKVFSIESAMDERKVQKMAGEMKRVAVIGSSHTAALATMHLLEAGIHVDQFINAPYKYAQPITLNNQVSTLFDNTGLKGQVAEFTKQLTTDLVGEKYKKAMNFYVSNTQNLKRILPKCSHVVFAIGFQAADTVKIEDYFDQPLTHDPLTSILRDGIFGIGISFPLQQLNCGILEYQVGYGKFWNTINDYVLSIWQSYPVVAAMNFQSLAKPDSAARAKLNLPHHRL